MISKYKHHLLISLIAAVVVYFLFMLFLNFDSVTAHLFSINLTTLFFLLSLSLMNYLFRFFKWHYYINILNLNVGWKNSALIFFSGLAMSVSPGKAGESLKSYLMKISDGIPISKSLPIVLAERITDFLSLILLAAVGVYFYEMGSGITIAALIVTIITAVFFTSSAVTNKVLSIFSKIKFIKKKIHLLEQSLASAEILLKPKVTIKMTLFSLSAWFFECFEFYIVLNYFDINFSPLLPTFVYSLSTIAGALTMIPGGLGATEASLGFLLIQFGVAKDIAITSTIIVRLATLWFAVLIGVSALSLFGIKFKNSSDF